MFGSDDIMLPDKTEKQLAFMEAHADVAVCGGNALVIDENGVPAIKRQRFPAYREITFEHLFADTGPGIVASTAMIRKSVLDQEGGWDPEIPLEDMYMWFKLTSRHYRMVGLEDTLIKYRKHSSNTYKNIRHMYESMDKTLAPYRSHPLYPSVHLNFLRKYFLTAAKHDKKLARKILPRIPFTAYNKKVFRGLLYLYLF
jgi:alpha-1,3-rhamnosyltransferase